MGAVEPRPFPDQRHRPRLVVGRGRGARGVSQRQAPARTSFNRCAAPATGQSFSDGSYRRIERPVAPADQDAQPLLLRLPHAVDSDRLQERYRLGDRLQGLRHPEEPSFSLTRTSRHVSTTASSGVRPRRRLPVHWTTRVLPIMVGIALVYGLVATAALFRVRWVQSYSVGHG
jgi:hypothetical protein